MAPPSSKQITCSRSCSTARKQATHQGQRNVWPCAARARLAAKGQTANLRQGTPAAQRSPIAGPFETNQEAKVWAVLSPRHEEYRVRNLKLWCREHAELFAPDNWERAYGGLRQVQAWLLGRKPRAVTQWKGWTLTEPAQYPAERQRRGAGE